VLLSEHPDVGAAPRRAHPLTWLPLALLGLAAVLVLMGLSIRFGVARAVRPPAWPGLDVPRTVAGHRTELALGVLAAAAALVACWGWLQHRGGDRVRLRVVALVAAVWAVPLVLGPPLLSNDVYSYAAVGRLTQLGSDPYLVGPSVLGRGHFLAAVEPMWRHTPTPYGPLMVALLRGVAVLGQGSVLHTVIALRVIAVLVTVGAVAAAVAVAAPRCRARVLLLTAANPLVLLHLVSGTHLDGLIGAAVIAVVVLTVRGLPYPAVLLAVAAGLVKAPAFLLVGFVLLFVVRHGALRRRVLDGLGVGAAAAVGVGASWLLLPDAFGWVHALGVPALARNERAPSAWLAAALHDTAHLLGAQLRWGAAVSTARTITLVVGAALAVYLLFRATARRDRETALRSVGWALLVLALSGPVLYGWYLAWGLFAAAAVARPRERVALAALCVTVCALGLPGVHGIDSGVQAAVWTAVAVVWWAARPVLPWRRRPSEVRAT
jgi:hypothetical protein